MAFNWQKLFENWTWHNRTQSKDTPINATNLNKINNAIDGIDNRVVAVGEALDELVNETILVKPAEYTSADCNSWTNKGVYQGVDAYNSPVSGWITVVTIPIGNNNFDYCEQKLFPINSNAVYSRYRTNGTWSGWTRIDGGAGWTQILSGVTSESDYHQLNITNIKSKYSELIVCMAVASHTDDYVYTITIPTNTIDVFGKVFYGTKYESSNDYNMGYIQFDTSNSRVKVCNRHNGSSISTNFKVYAR